MGKTAPISTPSSLDLGYKSQASTVRRPYEETNVGNHGEELVLPDQDHASSFLSIFMCDIDTRSRSRKDTWLLPGPSPRISARDSPPESDDASNMNRYSLPNGDPGMPPTPPASSRALRLLAACLLAAACVLMLNEPPYCTLGA
ncbi:hypothetical protein CTRI78_v005118 [Colletotrichum trifolii]|uniref:Uncharacterized protein n=1 Tax=Colletotrichum trifolii TaxID=5466 RepID=A0A4R8RFJ3_COLTR|nr:hypothetical protein CTRI78_v005118 [Colletotrichum trifolii]